MENEYEPYFLSLAWIAFREESLLIKMRAAPAPWAAKKILVDASRYAFGDTETGPARADLRPYIYRMGGPGDAASRLTRELRLGHVRSRHRVGDIVENWPPEFWGTAEVGFGLSDVFIINRKTHFPLTESDWTYVECNVIDIRKRFDAAFTMHNFQGIWKPIPHTDIEQANAAPSYPDLSADVETHAITLLARHLTDLGGERRNSFRREDARALLAAHLGLTSRGFDRVWTEARRKIGLNARAAAGRKPASKSPRQSP